MAHPLPQRQSLGRAAASAAVALALSVSALAAQQPGPGTADSVGRLWNPGAVQERDRAGSRENDSTVKGIEGKLRCTCGCNLDVFTCRTTDFTCATSPAMHRLVLARMDSGMTAEQVVDAFERQYGQAVLMAPPRRGFNWTAYVMPFVGFGVGLGLLVGLMRRWMRARPRQDPLAGGAAEVPGTASDAELERLKRELEKFEA